MGNGRHRHRWRTGIFHLFGLSGDDALTWGFIFLSGGSALFLFYLINRESESDS